MRRYRLECDCRRASRYGDVILKLAATHRAAHRDLALAELKRELVYMAVGELLRASAVALLDRECFRQIPRTCGQGKEVLSSVGSACGRAYRRVTETRREQVAHLRV